MIFSKPVGIISYGTALPTQCILSSEIENARNQEHSGIPESLGVSQKTVPNIDEDTITLSTDAVRQALSRSSQDSNDVGAIFIGSESHPYAVKPSSTIVTEALNLPSTMSSADLQFACKAGTAAMQLCASYVAADIHRSCISVGADTAQSHPGDVLEFTAGAGAAAYILGKEKLLATLLATSSVLSDTPDFWRRPMQQHPEHAGRFSGEPGYFHHIETAAKNLLQEVGLQPNDIDYCIFHTPNTKFPQTVAKQLGFSHKQLEKSLIVNQIGNTYAAAALLALANVLDTATSHKKILLVSYGSGAGSDAFLFETTPLLVKARRTWTGFISEQIAQLQPLSYQQYLANTQRH